MCKKFFLNINVFLILLIAVSCSKSNTFSERAKVSIRSIGHELLLNAQDITSLVLPVKEQDQNTYQLSFQNHLEINPDSLVAIVNRNFTKANFSTNYILEVKDCTNKEVVYSYEMKRTEENSIIPCRGRLLPTACYVIEIQFLQKQLATSQPLILYGALLVLLFIGVFVFLRTRNKKDVAAETSEDIQTLGIFEFYPDQNKLVKQAVEINLSKKECELLAIFISKPNEIVKREELTKKVWEDNGVIVGRSLDTYISKLRKKLKDDASIKITNIHGVGYKLEIN
ncbi:Winged helix family transcriptional regulator [Tenacibaculum sp. 190130A14a]|uniref:Winged helix family transcriptional regulator n=2 Tax=Tenacibaculum polynesiense TaxID=3137857 RepID=A0ABM9PD26_9FLAO